MNGGRCACVRTTSAKTRVIDTGFKLALVDPLENETNHFIARKYNRRLIIGDFDDPGKKNERFLIIIDEVLSRRFRRNFIKKYIYIYIRKVTLRTLGFSRTIRLLFLSRSKC